MKTIIIFGVTALLFTAIFFSACSGRIEGWEEIRDLSGEEKAELLEISLDSKYLLFGLDEMSVLKIEYGWAVLNWEQNLDRPSFHQFPYEIDNSVRPYFERTLARGTGVLPVVIIHIGHLELHLVIDPDSRTIVSESPGILTPVPDRSETEPSGQ